MVLLICSGWLQLNLFHNPETNRHNAQLVFTTHDTTVLEQTLIEKLDFIQKVVREQTKQDRRINKTGQLEFNFAQTDI